MLSFFDWQGLVPRVTGDRLSLSLEERSYLRRSFLADTIALIVFFTATGVINERFVARMD